MTKTQIKAFFHKNFDFVLYWSLQAVLLIVGLSVGILLFAKGLLGAVAAVAVIAITCMLINHMTFAEHIKLCQGRNDQQS